jgi:hypothetical protein
VIIDGELSAAWIHAGAVKVAFVFHVEEGLVREVELIADPDVLATHGRSSCSREILRACTRTDCCHPSDSPTP